jgi:hypothetical protein
MDTVPPGHVTEARSQDEASRLNNYERGMYPRDRRRWDDVFSKLANVSVSLLIFGPRMGKNHSRPILAGPDTMATLLSSEESFKREHHGSAENSRLTFFRKGHARRASQNLFHYLGGSAKLGHSWLSARPLCDREPYVFLMGRRLKKKPGNRHTMTTW